MSSTMSTSTPSLKLLLAHGFGMITNILCIVFAVALSCYLLDSVKLWCDCPFWPDDGMCCLRDCSVCECPDSEFPELFKSPFQRGLPTDNLMCQEGKPQSAVDRTLDTKSFRGWMVTDNPWANDDETNNDEMTYVNLKLNPERYTGYSGPSARRIRDAIYSENCPKYPPKELYVVQTDIWTSLFYFSPYSY